MAVYTYRLGLQWYDMESPGQSQLTFGQNNPYWPLQAALEIARAVNDCIYRVKKVYAQVPRAPESLTAQGHHTIPPGVLGSVMHYHSLLPRSLCCCQHPFGPSLDYSHTYRCI